jgi:TRAP-type mannitol/chloroaromatic compound transport system substrate-binding protein
LVAGFAAGLAMGGVGAASAQVHEGDIILEIAQGVIDTGRLVNGGEFESLRVFLA